MMNQNGSERLNCIERSTRTDIAIDFSCTIVYCSIEALMEKIKPVVTDKYNFGSRDKSVIIKKHHSIFGAIGILMQRIS